MKPSVTVLHGHRQTVPNRMTIVVKAFYFLFRKTKSHSRLWKAAVLKRVPSRHDTTGHNVFLRSQVTLNYNWFSACVIFWTESCHTTVLLLKCGACRRERITKHRALILHLIITEERGSSLSLWAMRHLLCSACSNWCNVHVSARARVHYAQYVHLRLLKACWIKAFAEMHMRMCPEVGR